MKTFKFCFIHENILVEFKNWSLIKPSRQYIFFLSQQTRKSWVKSSKLIYVGIDKIQREENWTLIPMGTGCTLSPYIQSHLEVVCSSEECYQDAQWDWRQMLGSLKMRRGEWVYWLKSETCWYKSGLEHAFRSKRSPQGVFLATNAIIRKRWHTYEMPTEAGKLVRGYDKDISKKVR